jgi:primosomal replication protein N
VVLVGTVASAPARRRTPAGSAVVSFGLRVEPSPTDPAGGGCRVPVVVLGGAADETTVAEGDMVEIDGALTERRWKTAGGARQSHFEILARKLRVL